MLVNPFLDKHKLVTYPGTRLLQETFDLVGARIQDPDEPYREWTLGGFYEPVKGRSLGGIRAKCSDSKGFISFVNQRDLEVLLGLVEPGSYCYWGQRRYPEPGDQDWYGFCADEDDLRDDLMDRELLFRGQMEDGLLESGTEFYRLVHLDRRYDVQELYTLLWDMDPETGMGPDIQLDTIDRRWKRVERSRVPWDLR